MLPLAIGLASALVTPSTHAIIGSAAPIVITDPSEATPAICEDVIDADDCHSRYPAGCSASGYDATLSFLKNRIDFPTVTSATVLKQSDFPKLEARLPKGLSAKNHNVFVARLKQIGEEQQFAIVGFLYPSKTEGSESSNCKLEGDESFVDFHLFVGFDGAIAQQLRNGKTFKGDEKKALNRDSVIVEMTPHFRERFQPDWTFENIKKLIGRQVKVVGQLVVDNEHNIPSQNCGLPNSNEATCWRASVWELHPVTQFWVCPDTSCAANSQTWMTVAQAVQ